MSTMLARSKPRNLRLLLLAVAILWVGFILRANRLDAKDLWVDEAHPWHFATLPLFQSIALGFSGGPVNSGADPLFNILLHFWIKLAGDSVYALRYLSVSASLLGVAWLGLVTRRVFGPRISAVALAVGAIAPVWVFYAQEVRPYAFTPVLMLIMIDAVIRLDKGHPRRIWLWVYLVCGEALALYMHGFMLVGVMAINGWLAALALRRWRQPGFMIWVRGWFLSQIAAGGLLLPTLSVNLARAGGIRNPFAAPRSAPEFATELWSYLMGIPFEHVFDPSPLRVVVALLLVGVAAGLVLALRKEASRVLADLAWLTLGMGGMALLYMWRDPSFHPRYALFMTGPLFLIVSVITARLWEATQGWRVVGGAASVLLILIATFSLDNLYTGRFQGYRHASTRVVAETLRAGFGPQDAIVVVAPHDFTLNYYGTGSVPILWSRFDEGVDQPDHLLTALAGKRKIGVLRNTNERSDSRRILPFYLERYGKLVSRQFFEGYDLATYQLDPGVVPGLALPEPVTHSWGDLAIDGVSIVSGDATTGAVRWVVGPSYVSGTRYAASIRLVDPITGWQISGADSLLLADNGDPTERWQPGQVSAQYFVLPLQPGVPPIKGDLLLTLYEVQTGQSLDLRDAAGAPAGQQARLGEVTLGRAPQTWVYENSQRLWSLQTVKSDVLAGYVIDKAVIPPGGSLGVTLAWTLPAAEFSKHDVAVQLVQGGVVVAEDRGPALQGRQVADVPPGQIWLDRRVLGVAVSAQPGKATLRVIMDGKPVNLAHLDVVGFERVMQRPPIENALEVVFDSGIKLLGYKLDAPSPITPSDAVNLTLYWQALANGSPDANFKVTAQILAADGHLVGQHDSAPSNETRPFSGWLAGEYVIDLHPIMFNQPYIGPITIQVALYDPVTFERALTESGMNALVLPVSLEVESIP